MQYFVEVTEDNDGPDIQPWVDQIFARKPVRPGIWNSTWSPGHGFDGTIHEEVSFDPVRQLFVDKRTVKPQSGVADANGHRPR